MEYRPDFNAIETGLDTFIHWDKDFIGKAATLRYKDDGVARKLVSLVVDTPIDVSLDEAILKGDDAIGYISSGGFAHHVEKSMAMGFVSIEHANAGSSMEVEILGERYPALIQGDAVYDPHGTRMRS